MSTSNTFTALARVLSAMVVVGGIAIAHAESPSRSAPLTRLPATTVTQEVGEPIFADLSPGLPTATHSLTSLETATADQAFTGIHGANGCEHLPPCCNICPCTYVFVDGLLWDRNNRAGTRPLVQDVNTGEPLLLTEQLDFQWAAGIRAVAGKRIHDCWAIELGYLGIFDQPADATLTSASQSLQIPGDLGLAVNNFSFADEVNVQYSAYLHSAEVNLVKCCGCCVTDTCCRSREWIYGFRYVRLGEQASITSTDPAESTSVYSLRTINDLYGVQVGARLRRCYGQWSWEGTGKAGIYANDAQQSQDPIVDFPNFVFRPARSASTTSAAFLGELNLTGIYQISDVWGLRLGYSLLWLEGVALALDQFDFTNTPASGTSINNDGGVLYHGVNIGVEARW